MGASLDSEDRSRRPDVLAEEMQDAAGAASQIDDPFAGPDADLFEPRVRIRREIGDLSLEALLLRQAATKDVHIWLRHGLLLTRGSSTSLQPRFRLPAGR